jgi:hypothetical protein
MSFKRGTWDILGCCSHFPAADEEWLGPLKEGYPKGHTGPDCRWAGWVVQLKASAPESPCC